jgi:3'(2'), 5'-bisphosphate nucleotidase
MSYGDWLQTAVHAAIVAGERIMEVYASEFLVELKSDESPLTRADRSAHLVILEILGPTGLPVLSEESDPGSYAKRATWERFWMVDPLDGTKEFIKRNGEFTVNIALIEAGRPKMGVIYVPVTNELYFSDGISAFYHNQVMDSPELNELKMSSRRLPFKETEQFTVVSSRSHSSPETEAFIRKMQAEHGEIAFLSKGSSLKLCMIAEGSAHVYPRFAPTMEWDTAAGQAICEAAGFSVVEAGTGESLKYNKPHLLNPWFVVQ